MQVHAARAQRRGARACRLSALFCRKTLPMRMASSPCGIATLPCRTSWNGSAFVLSTISITCVSCAEMRVDCASARDTASRTITPSAHRAQPCDMCAGGSKGALSMWRVIKRW